MVVILFYLCCSYDRNANNAGSEAMVLAGASFCSNYIFQSNEDYVKEICSSHFKYPNFHSLPVMG